MTSNLWKFVEKELLAWFSVIIRTQTQFLMHAIEDSVFTKIHTIPGTMIFSWQSIVLSGNFWHVQKNVLGSTIIPSATHKSSTTSLSFRKTLQFVYLLTIAMLCDRFIIIYTILTISLLEIELVIRDRIILLPF